MVQPIRDSPIKLALLKRISLTMHVLLYHIIQLIFPLNNASPELLN